MWSASLLLLASWLRKACGRLAQTVFILAGRLTLTVERVNDHEVSEAHGSLSTFESSVFYVHVAYFVFPSTNFDTCPS
jgi:hypothetical protein